MKRLLLTYTLALFLLPVKARSGEKLSPADYVNPFIGTTNFGTTNPGAVCPNGMMSVVPFNVMGSVDNKYDKEKILDTYIDSYYQDDVIDKYINEYMKLIKKKIHSIAKQIDNLGYYVDSEYINKLYDVVNPI